MSPGEILWAPLRCVRLSEAIFIFKRSISYLLANFSMIALLLKLAKCKFFEVKHCCLYLSLAKEYIVLVFDFNEQNHTLLCVTNFWIMQEPLQ